MPVGHPQKKRLSREALRSLRLMSARIITEGAGDCKRGKVALSLRDRERDCVIPFALR